MGGVYRIQTFLDFYIFLYLHGPLVGISDDPLCGYVDKFNKLCLMTGPSEDFFSEPHLFWWTVHGKRLVKQ